MAEAPDGGLPAFDVAPSPRGDEPLYGYVARVLRQDIADGRYPVGAQLPPEDRLCERFAVSRHTVRDALRQLREEGRIQSRKGSGTVVLSPVGAGRQALHATTINDLLSNSAGMYLDIDTLMRMPLNPDIAQDHGLPSEADWLAVRGIGRTDGIDLPNCWADYWIHPDYAAIGRLLRRHRGPIFPLIEDLFGETIAEVSQDISATTIPESLAGPLQAEAGSAAMVVRRAYRTEGGRIAQLTIGTYPAARFRHSLTLRRVRG